MSEFRDALAADLDAVFLNLDEFGEDIVLNGQEMAAIVDDGDTSWQGQSGDGLVDASGLGLQQQTKTIRVKDELDSPLRPEQRVDLDGEAYVVKSVKREDGLLVITLVYGYA